MELVVADAADEAFLLDLLNTTPVVDGTVRDELADPAAARRWMRERGIAATKVETAALVEVRSILQKVVRGDVRATALKPFVAGVALRPVAGPHGLAWRIETAKHRRVRSGRCWRGMPCGYRAQGAFGHVRTASAGCS